jgi:PAS domain S-box-containing protein
MLRNTVDENLKILDILWDSAEIGLALVNQDGKFLRVNPKFCTMLEYTEGELLDKTFHSVTHPDDLTADINAAKEVSDGKRDSYIMFKRYIPKTGDCIIWAKLHVEPIKQQDGNFLYFLSQTSEFAVQERIISTKVVKPEEIGIMDIVKFLLKRWKIVIAVISMTISLVYGASVFYNKLNTVIDDHSRPTHIESK